MRFFVSELSDMANLRNFRIVPPNPYSASLNNSYMCIFFKGEVVLCSSCLSGEATFTRNHLTTSHSRQTLRNPESIVGMYL